MSFHIHPGDIRVRQEACTSYHLSCGDTGSHFQYPDGFVQVVSDDRSGVVRGLHRFQGMTYGMVESLGTDQEAFVLIANLHRM
jgi:hypothetical protein